MGAHSIPTEGPAICANGKVVRRAQIEQRLLRAIQQELFTPEAVDYLTQRVQEELKRLSRQKQDQQATHHTLERELIQALRERETIKEAIRRGLISAITREMLEEIEARIQNLQAQLQAPRTSEVFVPSALPQAVQSKLRELDDVLQHDVSRSRSLLRDLLGEIVLRPTSEGLVAELRGNVEGLLRLEEALPGVTGNSGSGGWI